MRSRTVQLEIRRFHPTQSAGFLAPRTGNAPDTVRTTAQWTSNCSTPVAGSQLLKSDTFRARSSLLEPRKNPSVQHARARAHTPTQRVLTHIAWHKLLTSHARRWKMWASPYTWQAPERPRCIDAVNQVCRKSKSDAQSCQKCMMARKSEFEALCNDIEDYAENFCSAGGLNLQAVDLGEGEKPELSLGLNESTWFGESFVAHVMRRMARQ